jgi:hypothetical protein
MQAQYDATEVCDSVVKITIYVEGRPERKTKLVRLPSLNSGGI